MSDASHSRWRPETRFLDQIEAETVPTTETETSRLGLIKEHIIAMLKQMKVALAVFMSTHVW